MSPEAQQNLLKAPIPEGTQISNPDTPGAYRDETSGSWVIRTAPVEITQPIVPEEIPPESGKVTPVEVGAPTAPAPTPVEPTSSDTFVPTPGGNVVAPPAPAPVTNPDGSTTTTYPDGSSRTVYVDGSALVRGITGQVVTSTPAQTTTPPVTATPVATPVATPPATPAEPTAPVTTAPTAPTTSTTGGTATGGGTAAGTGGGTATGGTTVGGTTTPTGPEPLKPITPVEITPTQPIPTVEAPTTPPATTTPPGTETGTGGTTTTTPPTDTVPPVYVPPVTTPTTGWKGWGPITPLDWGNAPDLTVKGLNPGWITNVPAQYQTQNMQQSKFYWGRHPFQVGPTFNRELYTQAPAAPAQPWGLQQMYTPTNINQLVQNMMLQNQAAVAPTGAAPGPVKPV